MSEYCMNIKDLAFTGRYPPTAQGSNHLCILKIGDKEEEQQALISCLFLSTRKKKRLIDASINIYNDFVRVPKFGVCKLHKTLLFLFGIMNLHSSMILSTLSINSHGFAFGFSKKPRTNNMYTISRCGTLLPTILPLNKVHYRAYLEVYGALEPLNEMRKCF